ncbi:uncharacterized protein LOC131666798 [Phymastichus coffea]|uniref:uncharacterized protein LOC131666798 n=1 Tax=Phymastichus coffea TaxID=108790 RepID=UPI00273BE165|nr:uncharacterized protein LOC131666798 [Phymastichus coffea]
MSFCIRSIANGSKYVPTIVASAQGCNSARRFSSRQLPRHVKPVTSTFLNEFMGPNASLSLPLDAKEYCKLLDSSKESNINHPQYTYIYVNRWLNDSNTINNNDIESYAISSKKDLEFYGQEINHVSFIHSGIDQTVLSYNMNSVLPHEDNISVTYQEPNRKPQDQTYLLNMSAVTKEKPKLSTLPKAPAMLEEKNVDSQDKRATLHKKPSEDDLKFIYDTLSVDLPKFFIKSLNYKIYSSNIEFVNNIRGTRTKTAYEYVKQMAFLRIIGHLKFAYVKLELLKMTMHTSDNTIRVRWRIIGITGFKVLLQFWKFKVWKIRSEATRENEIWYDGYSTFYIGEDGLIYKHVADKMMPDQDEDIKPKSGLQSKLASQLGAKIV